MVREGKSRLVVVNNRDQFHKAKEYLNYRNRILQRPPIRTDTGTIDAMVALTLEHARATGWTGDAAAKVQWLHMWLRNSSENIEWLRRLHYGELCKMGEARRVGDWEAVRNHEDDIKKIEGQISGVLKQHKEIGETLDHAIADWNKNLMKTE